MYNFQNMIRLCGINNISHINGLRSLDRSVVVLGVPGKDGHHNLVYRRSFFLRNHETLIQILCYTGVL